MAQGSNITQLGQTLHEIAKGHVKVQTCWATVKEIDWEAKTMTVIGVLDSLPFYNVLLGIGSFYRRPTIGTDCLIGMIENKDAATFLIDAESIDEAVYLSGESTFTILPDGFILKQGEVSFKQVLNDFQTQVGKLCDELNKVIVTIGTGPNVALITAIKQKITGEITDKTNQIFKA